MIESVQAEINGYITLSFDNKYDVKITVPYHSITKLTTTMILADQEVINVAVNNAVHAATAQALRKIRSLRLYEDKKKNS